MCARCAYSTNNRLPSTVYGVLPLFILPFMILIILSTFILNGINTRRCRNARKTSLSILLLTFSLARSHSFSLCLCLSVPLFRSLALSVWHEAEPIYELAANSIYSPTYLGFDDECILYIFCSVRPARCVRCAVYTINSLFNEQTHARIHATQCQSPIDTNYLAHIILLFVVCIRDTNFASAATAVHFWVSRARLPARSRRLYNHRTKHMVEVTAVKEEREGERQSERESIARCLHSR